MERLESALHKHKKQLPISTGKRNIIGGQHFKKNFARSSTSMGSHTKPPTCLCEFSAVRFTDLLMTCRFDPTDESVGYYQPSASRTD